MPTNLSLMRRFVQRSTGSVLSLLLLLLAIPGSARAQSASARTTLLTQSAQAPTGAVATGALPGSQPLQVTLTLAPTADASSALDQFLTAVVTPSSPSYHQWLTPAQFAAQYGASATQITAITEWAESQGLTVGALSAGGNRLTLSGDAAQMEAAFAVTLSSYQIAGSVYFGTVAGNTAQPSLPASIASSVSAIHGLDNLPSGIASTPEALGATIDANASPILTLASTACSASFSPAQAETYRQLFRQAAAQGITVVVTSGCASGGSFPASLAEVTAISLAGAADDTDASVLSIARPSWQAVPGLPANAFRAEPDLTTPSLSAFAQTLSSIIQSTSGVRQGNINSVLYELAPIPGLYTQPDSPAAGTWEQATGLGTIDLTQFGKVYPHGTGSSFTSFSASSYAPTYGQSLTLSSTVTSGTGGATPTGTVTFTSTGLVLGSGALNGAGTATYTTSSLNAGTYLLGAVYSGDSTYATSSSVNASVIVQPVAATLSASVTSNNIIGGTYVVTVTDTVTQGQPTGTVTISVLNSTYTGTLAPATANSSSVAITIPATQVGTATMSITCSSSTNYTCSNPYTLLVTVAKATPTLSYTYLPTTLVSGGTVSLSANVNGYGTAPTPTGNVVFYDGTTVLGAGTLISGSVATTGTLPNTATHTITANYNGDANYVTVTATTPSNSPTTTSGTTTSLVASASSVTAGVPITFTATVTPAAIIGGALPTGAVLFYDGNTLLGSSNLTAGTTTSVATLTTNLLSSLVSHSITAIYQGSTTYVGSSSPGLPLSVGGTVTTTTALTASASTVTAGVAITFTATVTPASIVSSTLPAGTVSFYDGTTLLGSSTLTAGTASSVATFTTSTLSASVSHSITALYVGNTTYATSSSTAVPLAGTTGTATTTSLGASASSVTAGVAITFTATITPSTIVSSTLPTGTVAFYDGTTLLGSSTLTAGTASSVATFTTSTLSASVSHSITASYPGNTTYAGSTSTAVPLAGTTGLATVTAAPTYSPVSPTYGSTITFSTSVAPSTGTGTPTGTVQFLSGSTVLCSVTLSAGAGSCSTTTALAAGAYRVTASYGGDSTYAASVSSVTTVTVAATTATLTATISPTASVTAGTILTVTATVTLPTGTTTPPTGAIIVTINGVAGAVYSGTLSGIAGTNTATATIAVSAPVAGSYTAIVACPTGASYTCTPVSLAITTTAGSYATTTTLSISPTAPVVGQSVTLTAVVTSTQTSPVITGSVAFYDNGRLLGSVVLGSTGVVSIVATLSSGSQGLYAVYSGDSNYTTSTSATLTVIPTSGAPVSTAVYGNVTSALAGYDVILTAKIYGGTAANLVPTGTVTFYDNFQNNSVLLGSATLTAVGIGQSNASISTTGLLAGLHSITILYSGDTNFSTSTSSPLLISIYDYSVALVPSTMYVTQGQSATAVLTITSLNGFAGTVTFGCTPPANTYITCTFSPAVLTGGQGNVTMTVKTSLQGAVQSTTHAATTLSRPFAAGSAALAVLLCCVFPGRRRRRMIPTMLLVLLALGMSANLGCINSSVAGSGGSGSGGGGNSGTPLGTAIVVVDTLGSNGISTVAHDYQYQVSVE